jgi:hypothetical protein
MTWTEALEVVLARTKHEPYRAKCDESNPSHAIWRDRMIEKATGVPPVVADPPPADQDGDAPAVQPPSVAVAVSLLAATKACPYRALHPPCGCQGARCGLKAGAIVSHRDCFACVEAYGH